MPLYSMMHCCLLNNACLHEGPAQGSRSFVIIQIFSVTDKDFCQWNTVTIKCNQCTNPWNEAITQAETALLQFIRSYKCATLVTHLKHVLRGCSVATRVCNGNSIALFQSMITHIEIHIVGTKHGFTKWCLKHNDLTSCNNNNVILITLFRH